MRDTRERIGGICRTIKKGDLLEFLIGDQVIGYIECKGARGRCPVCFPSGDSSRAKIKIHFDAAVRIRPTDSTAQERGESEHGCNGAVSRSMTSESSGDSSSRRSSGGRSPVSRSDSRSGCCNEIHQPRSPVAKSCVAALRPVRPGCQCSGKRPEDKQGGGTVA